VFDLTESYKSLIEALRHAGIHTATRVNIEYIDSEALEISGADELNNASMRCWCRRFRRARHRRQDRRDTLCARKQDTLSGYLSGYAAGRDRICAPCCRMADANSTEFIWRPNILWLR